MSLPTKTCDGCGRTITWRKKWERDWDSVRWCSERCRRAGRSSVDEALERSVLELLASRAGGATICPSEAARALAEDWRPLMQPVRDTAAAMVDDGRLEVTQKGEVVDPRAARGAIRLRFPQ